nr:unnamed protein product [Spirometra erinaceieuropaei]
MSMWRSIPSPAVKRRAETNHVTTVPTQGSIRPSIQRNPQTLCTRHSAQGPLTWFSPPVETVARGVAAEQSPATWSHRCKDPEGYDWVVLSDILGTLVRLKFFPVVEVHQHDGTNPPQPTDRLCELRCVAWNVHLIPFQSARGVVKALSSIYVCHVPTYRCLGRGGNNSLGSPNDVKEMMLHPEEAVEVALDLSVENVCDKDAGYVHPRDNTMTIRVEWLQSQNLCHSHYNVYDDLLQTQRKELCQHSSRRPSRKSPVMATPPPPTAVSKQSSLQLPKNDSNEEEGDWQQDHSPHGTRRHSSFNALLDGRGKARRSLPTFTRVNWRLQRRYCQEQEEDDECSDGHSSCGENSIYLAVKSACVHSNLSSPARRPVAMKCWSSSANSVPSPQNDPSPTHPSLSPTTPVKSRCPSFSRSPEKELNSKPT